MFSVVFLLNKALKSVYLYHKVGRSCYVKLIFAKEKISLFSKAYSYNENVHDKCYFLYLRN